MLSNWILRRDDQIGCPTFTPIDEAEARLAARRSHSTKDASGTSSGRLHRIEGVGNLGLVYLVCCGVGAATVVAIPLLAQLT